MTEARYKFTRLVHEVEAGVHVELTRRGKPMAVLISADEYRQLSTERRSFWDAYQEFRRKHEGAEVDTADAFDGVRDPSPGRDFSW